MILLYAPDPDYLHNDPDFVSIPYAHIVPGHIDPNLFKAKDVNYDGGPKIKLPEAEQPNYDIPHDNPPQGLQQPTKNLSHYNDLFMRLPYDEKNKSVATSKLLSVRDWR